MKEHTLTKYERLSPYEKVYFNEIDNLLLKRGLLSKKAILKALEEKYKQQ